MPIPLPLLDQRAFVDLFGEGRDLLPRAAPGWTDYNYTDPGITLVDLLAWLTEMNYYRLDRVSPATYRSFLRLLGFAQRPARVARTVVLVESIGVTIPLPRGTRIANADASIVFQTTESLDVLPWRLVRVLAGPAAHLVDQTVNNQTAGAVYPAFGTPAKPDDALILRFDSNLVQPGNQCRLYVWTATADTDDLVRDRLIAEWRASRENDQCAPGPERKDPDWREHYWARTIWEYHGSDSAWHALEHVVDETRGLTLSGPVTFAAPSVAQTELVPIRCRLASGGYECPPMLSRVGINAVAVENVEDAGPENLGTSNGGASQSFSLKHQPVVPGSTSLILVQGAKIDRSWREALEWDQLGPFDRAYLIDPEDGTVTFGDGRVGRVPQSGVMLQATYQVGGGAVGNVASGALTQVLPSGQKSVLPPGRLTFQPDFQLTQPFAATGGTAAETIQDTRARALSWLDQPRRAITLADVQALALATPGVPIARAEVLADYDPRYPGLPALGCLTVIVVPSCPEPKPVPSPEFCVAVCRYLDRRRILCTELVVIGPCYTTVTVTAQLYPDGTAPTTTLVASAMSQLNAFLDPLTGGPDGTGWPLGRPVYRAEVMALLNGVPGVAYVNPVTLVASGGCDVQCGNVEICPHGLVTPGQHQITLASTTANGGCPHG